MMPWLELTVSVSKTKTTKVTTGYKFVLEQYYDKIRHEVKEQELKNQLSFTLITKILMGTLGCVPAYDRYLLQE